MKLRPPRWIRRWKQQFSHPRSLQRLQAVGFQPTTIYDIGAYQGGWTRLARRVYPSSEIIQFEANEENRAALEAGGARFFIGPLAAEDGEKRTFYLPEAGGIATGASLYRENTTHYATGRTRTREVTTRRLDSLAAEHRLPPPELIKLDVQGAELDVLSGAGALLKECGAVIAELSLLSYNQDAPLFAQTISGFDRLGFKCIDICEIHRTDFNSILQMDLLFVNAELFDRYRKQAGLQVNA